MCENPCLYIPLSYFCKFHIRVGQPSPVSPLHLLYTKSYLSTILTNMMLSKCQAIEDNKEGKGHEYREGKVLHKSSPLLIQTFTTRKPPQFILHIFFLFS